MVAYQLIPNPNDQRNTSQGDLKNNFTYLQTSVGVDHNFTNNSATSQDGYHNLIHLVPKATPANNAGAGQLYSKTGTTGNALHFMPSTGSEVQLTLFPIRALGNFSTAGTIAGSNFNSTCAKISVGNYRVTFVTALPTALYNIQLTVMPNSGTRIICQVKNGVVSTASFDITITDSSGGTFSDAFTQISYLCIGG